MAQFIQDRLQLYDDQHQTTSASHWNTIWTASQFFDAIDLIWPRGVKNSLNFFYQGPAPHYHAYSFRRY